MSLFSRLFGGGSKADTSPAAKPVAYNGFAIRPMPVKEGGRYRIGARITKEIGGQTRTHDLIRADTLEDFQTGVEASIRKAKQVIDEQGDRLFQ